MKKIVAAVLAGVMLFSLTACGRSSELIPTNPSTQSDKGSESDAVSNKPSSPGEVNSVQDETIKLTYGDEEVIVKMNDNPTSRDLLQRLPLTLTFEDYAGLEKIGYLPKALTTEGAPSGADPKLGDFALYAPWGNLVIYYGDSKYANGVVILGHIESGVEKFAKMNQDFSVTIERVN